MPGSDIHVHALVFSNAHARVCKCGSNVSGQVHIAVRKSRLRHTRDSATARDTIVRARSGCVEDKSEPINCSTFVAVARDGGTEWQHKLWSNASTTICDNSSQACLRTTSEVNIWPEASTFAGLATIDDENIRQSSSHYNTSKICTHNKGGE